MDNTILSLILLLSPFVGFLFNIFFGKSISKNVSGYIGTFAVIISFLITIVLFKGCKLRQGSCKAAREPGTMLIDSSRYPLGLNETTYFED